MPIYEYFCPICGHKKEVLQSHSEVFGTGTFLLSKITCHNCNKVMDRKVGSIASWEFKGALA